MINWKTTKRLIKKGFPIPPCSKESSVQGILGKSMKLIFNLLIRTILDSPSLLLPLLDALKLWCLNLVFLLCFIIFLPIFVADLTDIPLTVFEMFKFWLVEGIRFHIVLYLFCLIVVMCEEK